MIAPNGDHPTSPRILPQSRAISIAQSLPQDHRSLPNDIFPDMTLEPDLTLIYGLFAGTVLLLLFALGWSLLG